MWLIVFCVLRTEMLYVFIRYVMKPDLTGFRCLQVFINRIDSFNSIILYSLSIQQKTSPSSLLLSIHRSFDVQALCCWVFTCPLERSVVKWLDIICGGRMASVCFVWLGEILLSTTDSWTPKTPPESKTKVICKWQSSDVGGTPFSNHECGKG